MIMTSFATGATARCTKLENESLWSLFDRRGYEVFTFPEPGLCPLHVVRECPCPGDSSCADLIISDVNMMGANGIDFLEQLIQKGCKQRHFGLMSGGFSAVDLARASKLGCKLFTKPLDMRKVTVWVEEVERSIPSERMLYDWV
jgi:DNA-binding response OmpR family regulator